MNFFDAFARVVAQALTLIFFLGGTGSLVVIVLTVIDIVIDIVEPDVHSRHSKIDALQRAA